MKWTISDSPGLKKNLDPGTHAVSLDGKINKTKQNIIQKKKKKKTTKQTNKQTKNKKQNKTKNKNKKQQQKQQQKQNNRKKKKHTFIHF